MNAVPKTACMSEVAEAETRLSEALDRAAKAADMLVSRLHSVLRPVGYGAESSQAPAPQPVLSPLAEAITRRAADAEGIASRLEEASHALAI